MTHQASTPVPPPPPIATPSTFNPSYFYPQQSNTITMATPHFGPAMTYHHPFPTGAYPPELYHHTLVHAQIPHQTQMVPASRPLPTTVAVVTSSSSHADHILSPSLTSSGFSGSGGDCKSTETSSILSSASCSSSTKNPTRKPLVPNARLQPPAKIPGKDLDPAKMMKRPPLPQTTMMPSCDPYQVTLFSQHDKHIKKVKAWQMQQGYQTQTHPTAGEQKITNPLMDQFRGGEIKCEVCHVAVNSSHQLQAHIAGKFSTF